jgi:superfamily II DNA or RNA helicase
LSEIDSNKQRILDRLTSLDLEKKRLLQELQSLSELKSTSPETLFSVPKTPEEKADLFLSLFGARRSVYPKLWINSKTGQKGYSPACDNEWVRGICEKPRVKCAECRFQKFPPLDQKAVLAHLKGELVIGTYAIREDDTCIFLAADFDGEGWSTDAIAYQEAALVLGVETCLERSRSGEGAHVWIFFQEPVPASVARRLGTWIVSKTIALHPGLKLSTYDRFFPNQDILPKGGFGNLIALPLQKAVRDAGNSLFVNKELIPFSDQWDYLAKVRRYRFSEIQTILKDLLPEKSASLIVDPIEFSLSCDDKALDLIPAVVKRGDFSKTAKIVFGKDLQIDVEEMPARLVAALKRIATFPNPEFYHKQNMRFPTYGIPRFICSAESTPDKICLPRGVLPKVVELIKKAGGKVAVSDRQTASPTPALQFRGILKDFQKEALKVMEEEELGVLCAPPGSGKTVMGCHLMATRQVKTLILIHRQPLLDQWRERIQEFLKLEKKDIGILKTGKSLEKYPVVLGMIQSLVKNPDSEAILSQFGQIIVDECHHIPAASFESVLKLCRSKYILGLTATPKRKDGLEKILYMQCGPVRYEIKDQEKSIEKRVIFSPAPFRMKHDSERPPLHLVWEAMVQDKYRNQSIISDIQGAVREGRFSLVLSDRKDHLVTLYQLLKEALPEIPLFQLESLQGKKARKARILELEEHCEKQMPFILLSTSTLIGEGFDLPRLDTLFLTMPLSFKGRLIQYAGRLHRTAVGKKDVLIHDYYEPGSGLSMSMLRKRLIAYRQLGYQFDSPENPDQTFLFKPSEKL